MNKPHVHATLIKAWADGAEIEYKSQTGPWMGTGRSGPLWNPYVEYRIKPVPHPQQALIDAWFDGDNAIEYRGTDGVWKLVSANFVRAAYYPRDELSHDGYEFRRPHKWQKEMDALAAGGEVQFRQCRAFTNGPTVPDFIDGYKWHKLPPKFLQWEAWWLAFRIKPEVVERWMNVGSSMAAEFRLHGSVIAPSGRCNLKLTFEDNKLVRAEVL
jgi:hypothetical protein